MRPRTSAFPAPAGPGEHHDHSNPARQWSRAGRGQAANFGAALVMGDGERVSADADQLGHGLHFSS